MMFGDLGYGHFYVRTRIGNILIDHICYDRPNYKGFSYDVEKVIARVPSYEKLIKIKRENSRLKSQNKRLRDIIETCLRYLDNQRVTDAWADNLKMDIDDVMGDLGMEKIGD